MSTAKPIASAMERAKACCNWRGIDDPALRSVALALDAAREEGRREERAAIVARLRSATCNDPAHDNRWCPRCEYREDVSDLIELGAHVAKGGEDG